MLSLDKAILAATTAEEIKLFYLYDFEYINHEGLTRHLRYTSWDEKVSYDGHIYEAVPIKHSEVSTSSDGKINPISITVGNADGIIQGYLNTFEVLGQNATITEIILTPQNEPALISEFVLKIKDAVCNTKTAVFTLSIGFDVLKAEVPGRKIMSRFCWWTFKSDECGYAGSDIQCGRTFDDCLKKGNLSRFGGFPGVINERFYF